MSDLLPRPKDSDEEIASSDRQALGDVPRAGNSAAGRVDRMLSLAAGIAAVTAVAVSLYQTSLAREQLRASAWPYLGQSNSLVPGQPYVRAVTNEGVGPARVRSFAVLVDGRPVRTWNDAVRALTGGGEPGLLYSSFGRGTVLPPGTNRNLLTLPSGERALIFWREAQTRLHTVACYCSVYDECWQADSRSEEPRAVRACTNDSTMAFGQ
jgi:hypothetical protein